MTPARWQHPHVMSDVSSENCDNLVTFEFMSNNLYSLTTCSYGYGSYESKFWVFIWIYIYMDHMVPEVIAGEWMVISPSMTKGSNRCCPEMLRPFLKMGLSEDYEKLPLNILNRMEYHLREISITHICIYIYIFKIIQFSSFSPKTRYKRRHGAILWDTPTPLFVVENQMAKVPEPGSLTLRSEDWSVDCNPKSVSINGTLIQIPNGVTYQLYIYIFYIYIVVQNYTNRNPICIYIYVYS